MAYPDIPQSILEKTNLNHKIMSKFLYRTVVLTISLLALFSCRNETFYSETQKSKREEEFFKNTLQETALFSDAQKIIEELINENNRSHFVSKLKDKKGLPIWNKIKATKSKKTENKNDEEDYENLVIPLSENNTNLSSILYITKNSDGTFSFSNIDNKTLKEIINDTTLDKTYRENLYSSFIITDYLNFGTTFFWNAPSDLFDFIPKTTDASNRGFTIEIHETNNLVTIYTSIICIVYYVECSHCDGVFTPVTKCWQVHVYDDNGGGGGGNEGNSNPGNGNPSVGSGGGNTGNPNGGGQPQQPENPDVPPAGCGPNQPFYRPMPGCGGDPIETPCSTAKPAINRANTILKDTNVKNNMANFLSSKISAPNEWGVAVSRNNNEYSVTPPKEGSASQGSIPQPLPGDYVANGHSHANNYFGSPSGGDFYSALELISASTKFETMFVYGTSASGSVETYALVISDNTLATSFLSQYPKTENLDPISHAFLEQGDVGIEYYEAYKYAIQGIIENSTSTEYDSKALAMAYILEKLNTGISLAKMDNLGNLKKLNVSIEKIKDAASGNQIKTGLKVTKCP